MIADQSGPYMYIQLVHISDVRRKKTYKVNGEPVSFLVLPYPLMNG